MLAVDFWQFSYELSFWTTCEQALLKVVFLSEKTLLICSMFWGYFTAFLREHSHNSNQRSPFSTVTIIPRAHNKSEALHARRSLNEQKRHGTFLIHNLFAVVTGRLGLALIPRVVKALFIRYTQSAVKFYLFAATIAAAVRYNDFFMLCLGHS